MATKRLEWGTVGTRTYETGVDRGVLYPIVEGGAYGAGVAWSGLTAVNESPSGAEPTKLYADNMKYLTLTSAEEFGATIECYTTPPEFDACDGKGELVTGVRVSQQNRKVFGFSYRTLIGNDTEGTDHGYTIHLVYGCHAKPTQKNRSTVNENPEAATMSYEISTDPVEVGEGFKPCAHIEIDSTTLTEAQLKAVEDKIYGSDSSEPTLPLPKELKALIESAGA